LLAAVALHEAVIETWLSCSAKQQFSDLGRMNHKDVASVVGQVRKLSRPKARSYVPKIAADDAIIFDARSRPHGNVPRKVPLGHCVRQQVEDFDMNDVERRLLALVEQRTKQQPKLDDPLTALGIDSIEMAHFVGVLEKEFPLLKA
jgi:hypothetical protein